MTKERSSLVRSPHPHSSKCRSSLARYIWRRRRSLYTRRSSAGIQRGEVCSLRGFCARPVRTDATLLSELPSAESLAHQRHGLCAARERLARPCRRLRCKASSSAAAQPPAQPGLQRLGKLVSDQYLPLALLVGLSAGFICPGLGVRAAAFGLQNWTTTGIFVISGLALRRGDTLVALSSWGAVLFGLVSILALTPAAALLALRLPLQPPELAFGLAVFCCMPTTLSSGISLTQAVGGNTALALLLTVGSNLLGIFTMPFMLSAVLGAGGGTVRIAPGPLLRSLLRTILAPLAAGAAARALLPALARTVDGRKKQLSMLSATLLAMVPWMQISRAAADNMALPATAVLAAVGAGVALHAAFLAFNLAAASALRLGGEHGSKGFRRGIALVASQKTLSVAALVVPQVAGSRGGLAMAAVVPVYLLQLACDYILAARWALDAIPGSEPLSLAEDRDQADFTAL